MTDPAPEANELSFEELLKRLEVIVKRLEDGQLGLGEALDCYEEGIGYLKKCHAGLEVAERRIELLTSVNEDGSAEIAPFDDEHLSDEAKVDARSRRRRM